MKDNNIVSKLQKEQAVENFKKWFGNSQIINSSGEPEIVYTGTLSDFTVFDYSKSNNQNFFGKGFYFSSSIEDVNSNYATVKGPDFEIKYDKIKENFFRIMEGYDEFNKEDIDYFISLSNNKSIEQPILSAVQKLLSCIDEVEDYSEMTEEEMDLISTKYINDKLSVDNQGFIIPAYIKMENPLRVDHDFLEKEEKISGQEFERILSKFESLFNFDKSALYNEFYHLFSDINEEYSIEFDEFEEIAENFRHYIFEEDEDTYEEKYLEFINFARDVFDSDYINITYELNGSLIEFKDRFKRKLQDLGFFNEADNFESLFSEKYLIEETVYVRDILKNEDIDMLIMDLFPMDNQFDNDCFIYKGLCAAIFQEMGYDGIIQEAFKEFKTMKNISEAYHYIVFNSNNIKSAIGNNGEYSLTDNDIRYRINYRMQEDYRKKISVNTKDCEKIIKDIKEQYSSSPNIILIKNKLEIDKELLNQHKDILNSSGYYLKEKNSVYIMLENITGRKDFIKTIAHEIFGHMSLQEILKNNYTPFLNKVYDFYDKKGLLEEEKKHYSSIYGNNFNDINIKSKIAEEKMANVIEEQGFKNFPLKNVIIGAIKNSLRKLLPNIPFGNSDIIYIAQQTHNNLKKKNKKENKIKNKNRF
jgi:hypothetical protein